MIKIMTKAAGTYEGQDVAYIFLNNAPTFTRKSEAEKWLEINKKYSEIWPNINKQKEHPQDWEEFKNEENKFEKYFKENL